MSEWFNNFVAGLDGETITLLGAGIGSMFIAMFAAVKGYRQGSPNPTTTAQAIAQNSCGAPEISTQVLHIANRLSTLEQMADGQKDTSKEMLRLLIKLEDRVQR